jgi:hypothetical protein
MHTELGGKTYRLNMVSARWANAHPMSFMPKNNFLATELKRGEKEIQIFSKRLFEWCEDKK